MSSDYNKAVVVYSGDAPLAAVSTIEGSFEGLLGVVDQAQKEVFRLKFNDLVGYIAKRDCLSNERMIIGDPNELISNTVSELSSMTNIESINNQPINEYLVTLAIGEAEFRSGGVRLTD